LLARGFTKAPSQIGFVEIHFLNLSSMQCGLSIEFLQQSLNFAVVDCKDAKINVDIICVKEQPIFSKSA
jgi:hypothetical protein